MRVSHAGGRKRWTDLQLQDWARRHGAAFALPPDLASRVHNQLQLAPLLVDGQVRAVAL